ncbi:MAG: large-conductance mechanosensitive channel protein MscL [Prevotellaceae bacterium]|nr:large-conductance mechanosensitive channel protein MscL [Candidatus Faecinaster equi]
MKKSKFIQEFKEFAIKGNAIDMAVGIIIGAAFGKIVSSLVDDIIMPPIGWLIGGVDFKDLMIKLPTMEIEGIKMEEVAIKYGNFIQTTLDFIIIAFCVFLLVKAVIKLTSKKKEEEATAPTPEPSNEEKLLTEIRDLLKNK